MKFKLFLKKALKMTFALIAILIMVGIAFVTLSPQFGARAEGARRQLLQQSDHFRAGKFHNSVETRLLTSFSAQMWAMIDYFKGGLEREPKTPLPSRPFDRLTLPVTNPEAMTITWLGHSTVLIEMDGVTILTDPIFSGKASPIPFMGPKAFPGTSVLPVDEIPPVDIVLISHDHYDHLDHETIVVLKDKVKTFIMPLGVGAHLEKWGVSPDQIIERDWWETVEKNNLVFTAAPARHFSGRGLTTRNTTLWCAWAIKGRQHNIFFGGDSGYFDGFKTIGKKLGPFDLAMLECGAYSEYWPDVHMLPEETAQAALDVQGRVLMPIHWAKFNLSLHSWTEPVERLSAKAEELGVPLTTPMIGERFVVGEVLVSDVWWRI